MALSAECERAGFTCTRRQMRFEVIWISNWMCALIVTHTHTHTGTHGHTLSTHMGSGTLLAAEWRVTFANWQHLTWMLTHAQHQLSIWPWPAAGAAAAAAAENRWPIEAPTSRQFPHFPAHTSMGTCAALRCVIEIRPSSKSVWVHSSIHSLSHTHTHSYSDTLARDVELAFAAAAAALETQITITWNAFQSAAESVAYSSAPTARQLSPQPFYFFSHIPHMPVCLRKVTGKCFCLSSA